MTCNIQKLKTDYYIPENDEIRNLEIDQTVIIKEDFLKYISHEKKRETQTEFGDSAFLDDWYPFVNSYYPYTEDVDAFARVSHLLGSKPSFASLSSGEGQSQIDVEQNKIPYSENAAQNLYLDSNPINFIILGKPSIGEQELGRQLAEYWQCVYIEPKTVIEQEIMSGSRAGECIQFNLNCGRAIGIDVILRLVEKRVKSESAKHRGFVICGLPLIPNDLYQEDPISSESAVFTVKEIFEEMFDVTMDTAAVPPSKPPVSVSSKYKSEEGEVEEEDAKEEKENNEEEEESDEVEKPIVPPKEPPELKIPLDTGPDYDICHPPEISMNYEDQLNFIFDLIKHPFMIIYIMCSSADVIEKRKNYRFDVNSKQTVNFQTELYNKLIFDLLSKQENADEEIPEDFLETSYMNIDTAQLNYLIKLPRHFPANISTQLDSFHYTGLNFIERRVLMHDPQYFLKVDGRVSIQRMFYLVKSRLKILPIQQVILPTRLNIEPMDIIGEDDQQEFRSQATSLNDYFREFSRRDVPSSTFKWNWSDWGTMCPVALKEGILKDGDANYAVHFMNKIFFLANEENFFKFYRNPRPYLLPPCPKPACKIFIFGPKCSGKSAVSRALGYLLNGTVLSIADMLALFLLNQQEEIREKIRQAAIAEAMKLLNEQRAEEAKQLEMERTEKIKEWIISTKKLIEDLIHVLIEREKDQTVTSFELSSFPMAMKKVSLQEAETPLAMEFIRLREQITSLRIPFSVKVEDWQTMLQEKRKMLIYLPRGLRSRVVAKPAKVFDDFVVEYARRAVENADLHDASISNKSLATIIINHIKAVEDEQIQQGNNKGGWILDGMICDLPVLEEMYPEFIADEVIALIDEDDCQFLTNRYENEGDIDFSEYRDFFMNIGKFDAAWRSPVKITKKPSVVRFAREILSEMIDDPNVFDYGDGGPLGKVDIYRQDVLNFNQKWDETKKYFLDRNIEPMEIKVTDKSMKDLMLDVITAVEDRYRVNASLYTELDRAEDVKNFGNQMLQKDVGEGAEFSANEDLSFKENRRYGDTYYYCPVTFHDKGVLWKGKEDYAVKFENKLYLLSNEEDMKKFLQVPRRYLTGEPPEEFPPPRICVVGIPGIGKTTLSKALAKNYGLAYASFETILKKCLNITTPQSLNDLRRDEGVNSTLYEYLNADVPLEEDIFKAEISKLWFEQPTLGFVFDDFPKRPSDIKYMTTNKLIPDIVINLTNDSREIKDKLVQDHMVRWEEEINKKKLLSEENNKVARLEWEKVRMKRFEELIEGKREQRYAEKRKKKAEALEQARLDSVKEVDEENVKKRTDPDKSGFRTDSQVSFDSVEDQDDINEVNLMLNQELPEPVFEDNLESADEVKDQFEILASETITVETGFLKSINALCLSDEIQFTDIIVHFDYPELTERKAFVAIDKFKFRKKSHFERCYDISMEVAERLLSCGYFFLSKFGRTCPVQYYEDTNPVQVYAPMEQRHNLYPVIHRTYIYYTVGRENQQKFKEDPLKYILIESFHFPLITFKLAVIGPPKCGKTTLSTRIAKEFGLKVISRGQAARYVLTYLPLSDLAKTMESVLRKGWELTDEMVVKCVEAACFDSKAVTQGLVFDGFPNTITEVRHLSYVALVPNLAIDLQATHSEVLECLSFDVGRRNLPKFSERFVNHLHKEWRDTFIVFREWLDREYQILAKIPISTSNWSVWTQAKTYMTAVFFEIKHYFVHASDDWPLRLANMQITPLEFLERQGAFKIYCPCCLHFSNILTSGGSPPDRTGLVQYRYFFYWICKDHMELFLASPDAFLVPYNNHRLPQELPERVSLLRLPNNVFEEGVCVVCYKQKRTYKKGNLQFAISYAEKVYIFCTQQCLIEFTKNPLKFMIDINFKPPDNYASLKYQDLPIIGMLEQYVAKYVTKALSFIARRRPVIPGLSIQASALVGLGLYLKIFNPKITEECKPLYTQADDLYHTRRTKLINYLDKMKSVINPYLHYEEPLPQFNLPVSVKSESTESVCTTVTKIVDEIVDNLDYDTD